MVGLWLEWCLFHNDMRKRYETHLRHDKKWIYETIAPGRNYGCLLARNTNTKHGRGTRGIRRNAESCARNPNNKPTKIARARFRKDVARNVSSNRNPTIPKNQKRIHVHNLP